MRLPSNSAFVAEAVNEKWQAKHGEMDNSANRKRPVFNWVRAYAVMGFRLVSFGHTSKYPWPWPIGPCKHRKKILKIKKLKMKNENFKVITLHLYLFYSLFSSFFFFVATCRVLGFCVTTSVSKLMSL